MSAYTPQQLEAAIAKALKDGNPEMATKLGYELQQMMKAPASGKQKLPVLAHEEWAGGKIDEMNPAQKMLLGAKSGLANIANGVVETFNPRKLPFVGEKAEPGKPIKPLIPSLDYASAVGKQAVQSAGPWAQGAEFATSILPEAAAAAATRGTSFLKKSATQFVVPAVTTDGDWIDRAVAGGLNGGLYSAFGAANKLAGVGGDFVNTYIRHPFTEEGRRIIAKQTMMQHSSNPNKLAENIANADQPLLKGSHYSLAESIPGDQGLAQLQRVSVTNNPHFQNYLTSIRNRQNGTYDDILTKMSGATIDPKSGMSMYDLAKQTRELNSSKNYGLAESTPLNFGKSAQKRADSLLQRPIVQEAVGNARTNLANAGKTMAPEGSIQGLQHVRQYMSRKLNSLKSPDANPTFDEINGLTVALKDMDKFLANVSPEFGKAQKAYRQDSVPVNQMEVANLLRQKLFPPVTQFSDQIPNKVQPATFFRSLTDKGGRDMDDARGIVRQATGYNKTLDDVMTGEQLYGIESIAKELARRQHVEGAMKPNGEAISGQINQQQREMLNRAPFAFMSGGWALPVSRAITNAFGKDLDKAASLTQRELARALASPKYANKVMAQEVQPNFFRRIDPGVAPVGGLLGSAIDYRLQHNQE